MFAVGYLAHAVTLRFEFLTSWDDPTYVVDNPWIRGFTRENLAFVWTQPYFSNFLPLHLISYMVDYSLWGLNPFGYHLQSVLLHAINAVLALLVVRRLFGDLPLAFLAALLFAVHPSHVEAVAWVSIRKDVLSTAFLFLSVFFYEGAIWRRGKGGRAGGGGGAGGVLAPFRYGPYLASFACFTLGLLAKMSVVTLPLFLLLLDALRPPGERPVPWKAAIASKIPFAVVGGWLTYLNAQAQVKAQAAYAHDPIRYLMVKGHAVWNYLALLTGVPKGRPIYDTPELSLGPASIAFHLVALVLLPAAFVLAYRARRRLVALGVGWIFALILPAVLFPLVTYMADRYLYAPSLGFCWMLAGGIWLVARKAPAGPARIGAVVLVAAVPLALFVARTAEYNAVWRNAETLWTYGAARSRDFRARNNLAQVRLNQGRFAEAERLYRDASRIPNITSFQGLAVVFYNQKRYEDAQREIDRAFEVYRTRGAAADETAELEFTRGAIAWVRSDRATAVDAWRAALRANPRHARAREWLRTVGAAP